MSNQRTVSSKRAIKGIEIRVIQSEPKILRLVIYLFRLVGAGGFGLELRTQAW